MISGQFSCLNHALKFPKDDRKAFHKCASVTPWLLVCVKFGLLFWGRREMVEDSLRTKYGGHLDKTRTKYKPLKITTYGKFKT
jgi:hypothetical protein